MYTYLYIYYTCILYIHIYTYTYLYIWRESLFATNGQNSPWDLPSVPAEAWEEGVRLCSIVEHFHAVGFRLVCNLHAKFHSP